MMKPTLTIVGAGKVGRVLGRQFVQHDVFELRQILNRSLSSAQSARDFIGAGVAIDNWADLKAADMMMLTVPDDQIKTCAAQLVRHDLIGPTTIVFHCSGALGASELGLLRGAASLHPVRSFADPENVAQHFSKTICSLEGDADATAVLTKALEQIDAQVVHLESAGKTLYHAAAVFASNYLVTLMDTALTTYQAAGIPLEMAQRLAAPLAQETLSNVFRIGAQQALTGPIARGDLATVARHQSTLDQVDRDTARLYQELAQATLRMKQRRE